MFQLTAAGFNALTFAISPKCNVLISARTPQLFDNEMSLMFVCLAHSLHESPNPSE